MNRPKPIQIHIPQPCSQNWDEMTSVDQGKFCAHCQKKVTDFTEWSDAALYNFFSKNTDHVCGRFLSSQVNRIINIPYQPNSQLYRIAVALGLTIMFVGSPEVRAQNRPPLIEQNSLLKKVDNSAGNQSGGLYGRVFDEKKEPIISAVVQVFEDGILKGGTVTDYDGNFLIKPLESGNYNVSVIYSGYDSSTVNNVTIGTDSINLNFYLKRSKCNLFIIGALSSEFKVPLVDKNDPDKKTIDRSNLNHIPH